MLQSTTGNFVIVGISGPKYFWKGQELTEVDRVLFHSDTDETSIKLKVQNTTNFDSVYAELESAGIDIKKINN
mgnify:CR=1 FL=1